MGLDTTSYSKITAMPEDWAPPVRFGEVDYDWLFNEGIRRAWTYDTFPRAMDGIEGGHESDPYHEGFLGSRWYKMENSGPSTSASYLGHGDYRKKLRKAFWNNELAPIEQPPNTPFIDLIWFADNQGILGPEACARLVADYERYPELPVDIDPYDRYHRYHKAWTVAVKHAAGSGCIRFH